MGGTGGATAAPALSAVASASPEEFRAFLVAQKQRWGDVVKSAKIPLAD